MDEDEIYREVILDNYKNPKNKGRLKNPSGHAFDANPLCGDEIGLEVKVKKGKIVDVKFMGEGCAISVACASLLTQWAKGKTFGQVQKADKRMVMQMIGGIDPGPARVKCALLPLKVLKLAAIDAQTKGGIKIKNSRAGK